MFYSESTGGFYDAGIHGDAIPADAVEISDDAWRALLVAQASGLPIRADANGNPVAQELTQSLSDQNTQLLARATAQRWEIETGGIALPSGAHVATSKNDQDRITSVLVNAQAAGIESVEFKAESGWLTLTLPELRTIATAIARHVQACFSAERAHHEAIAELQSIDEAKAYDINAGWPA